MNQTSHKENHNTTLQTVLKGMVHPKITILLLITQPHAVPNL